MNFGIIDMVFKWFIYTVLYPSGAINDEYQRIIVGMKTQITKIK